MKKALLVLLVVFAVGAVAFADDAAKAALKPDAGLVTEFTANAVMGVAGDIDTAAVAFYNSFGGDIKLQLLDKASSYATTGSGMWAEIKVVGDGDPFAIFVDPTSATDQQTKVLHLNLDTAKLHFGDNAFLSLISAGTDIGYVEIPDVSAPFLQASGLYGATLSGGPTGSDTNQGRLLAKAAAEAASAAVKAGFQFGISVPNVAYVNLNAGSLDAFVDGTTGYTSANPNEFATKAIIGLSAVTNLTAEVAGTVAFGGDSNMLGAGAKLGYKLPLVDKFYLKPNVTLSAGIAGTTTSWVVGAGVLLGAGDKTTQGPTTYFFKDSGSQDWGFYPGLAVAVMYDDAGALGLNVSAMTKEELVGGLKAAVAFEIDNLLTTGAMETGVSGVVTYALKADTITVTPKVGLNLHMLGAATNTFAKAGMDVAGIFNNTTFSVEYASNDFSSYLKFGKLSAQAKISF